MENRPALIAGLTMAAEETVLFVALWAAAIAIWVVNGPDDPEARLWSVLMVVQSLPYAAALYLSMVNALSTLKQQRRLAAPASVDTGVGTPALAAAAS
jgi:hypothetical protein